MFRNYRFLDRKTDETDGKKENEQKENYLPLINSRVTSVVIYRSSYFYLIFVLTLIDTVYHLGYE